LAVTSLAILGVVGTGIGTFLFNKMVLDQGPLFAGMVTYLVPVGALIWGWIDAEQVTWLQFVALAGIFAMVALVQFGGAHVRSEESEASSREEHERGTGNSECGAEDGV
jgi:drug/metabolite transporter (DMT)-like permease